MFRDLFVVTTVCAGAFAATAMIGANSGAIQDQHAPAGEKNILTASVSCSNALPTNALNCDEIVAN